MSRIYTVRFAALSFSAQTDFFEITPADDKPCKILGLFLGQSSDVGDAASENVPIKIVHLAATLTSGSGGSTPTPIPLDPLSTAAGFGAETGNTTIATSTNGETVLFEDVWNVNAGYQLWIPQGLEPVARQGAALCVRSYGAPADPLTTHGTLFIEEA